MATLWTSRLAAVLAAALCWRGMAQDVVSLRTDAEAPAGGVVRLSDVAELSGGGAESLADVIVARDLGAGASVSVEQVRRAIEDHGKANLGALRIRGGTCRVAPKGKGQEPESMVAAPIAPATGRTVRDVVLERIHAEIGAAVGVSAEDLMAEWDEGSAELLGVGVEGRTVDIRLVGSSERQPINVRVIESLRTVAEGTVRARLTVRREVCLAARDLRRGEVIGEGDLKMETRWVPAVLACAGQQDLIGTTVRSKLNEGDVVGRGDTDSPIIVKRGEIVEVHCLAGGVSVKTPARAIEDGREGQVVKFRTVDSKREFRARVDGPGRAMTEPGMADDVAVKPAAKKTVRPAESAEALARRRESERRATRNYDLGDKPVPKKSVQRAKEIGA